MYRSLGTSGDLCFESNARRKKINKNKKGARNGAQGILQPEVYINDSTTCRNEKKKKK